MRKLARIERIEEIRPIEGADKIEHARVKGWWVVVKKFEFKKGDLAVYFEIDSLLPLIPQFDFLAKGSKPKKIIIGDGKEIEGYRLKTVRLRGCISQGLLLPCSQFPLIPGHLMSEGADLTEIIGVHKFNPPLDVSISGDAKGMRPGFIPKTDEERVQNCVDLLEKYKGHRFVVTSKIDGTSSTFYKHEEEFGCCGHNIEFKDTPKNAFWQLAHRYQLPERFPDGYAFQGEVAGEKIQKNRLKLKGIDFFGFYVVDLRTGEYLRHEDMLNFAEDLGLKTVPVIDDNFILDHTVDQLLELAEIDSPLSPGYLQEGSVYRLYDSTCKISFKAVSNKYLLKHGL